MFEFGCGLISWYIFFSGSGSEVGEIGPTMHNQGFVAKN